MISISNLYKSFGKLTVLQDISIELLPGKISAILGPNGSGKTTLIKSILGMVLPNKGEILVRGSAVANHWQYRNHISYVPQIAQFPSNLTVNELLDMIKAVRCQPAFEKPLLERFGLAPHLNKKAGTLSGGTRQKVNLVLALMFDSPIVIMDEPTAGLDPVAMIELKHLVEEMRQQGKCIIITTHIIPLVQELADDIVFLLEGKVYFRGAPGELMALSGRTSLEESIASMLVAHNQKSTVTT